uniref:Uncharacterized protein n=1 Tax=Panagrolaimus sp. JU765 TaxID=591449 RepID=A0AC34R4N1_9BILA
MPDLPNIEESLVKLLAQERLLKFAPALAQNSVKHADDLLHVTDEELSMPDLPNIEESLVKLLAQERLLKFAPALAQNSVKHPDDLLHVTDEELSVGFLGTEIR